MFGEHDTGSIPHFIVVSVNSLIVYSPHICISTITSWNWDSIQLTYSHRQYNRLD